MRLWLSLGLALITATALSAAARKPVQMRALFPPSNFVRGWKWKTEPKYYKPADLHKHINGAADLFLAYGVRQAAVVDFYRTRSDWVSMDVYDMGSPLNAFGIYGSEKPEQTKPLDIGAQAQSSDNLATFWKGPFYVKVALIDGKDKAAVLSLARAAAMYVPGSTALPPRLRELPSQHRVKDSERYIRQGVLGHKFLSNAVSADYKIGAADATLYISAVGGPSRAKQVLKELRAFEQKTGKQLVDIADFKEGGFAVTDPYLGQMVTKLDYDNLIIAVSEKAKRDDLVSFVKAVKVTVRPRVIYAK